MNTAGKSKSRRLLVLPPVLLGVGILFFMVSGKKPPEQTSLQEIARFVRIIEARSGRFTPVAEGYGVVKPAQVWDAVSQVSGRVVFMHPSLRNGGIISAGSELVRIDPVDYELALAEARNELAELEVQGENTQASLNIETRNLELVEKEFRRQQKLVQQGTISRSLADESERALLASRSLVQNLENSLALLPVQRKLLEYKITQAQRNLDNTRISAPFNLRIADLAIEQHQFVSSGQTLFSGDSIDRVEVTARIAAHSLKKLFIGQPQFATDINSLNANLADITGFRPTVRLDIGGEQQAEWEAEFVRISDSVDAQTQTIGIVVAVDKPMQKIIPGVRPPLSKDMFVQVSIAGHPQDNRIVVPRSLIRSNQIYKVDQQGRLQIVDVSRLYDQQRFSVISQGIEPGDLIVASDLVPAVAGMLLKTEVDIDLQNSLNFAE